MKSSNNPTPTPSSGVLINMPEEIQNKFEYLFLDPIQMYEITTPWITPQGSTYQQDSIISCINKKAKDPYDTQSALNISDLVHNNLFLRIKELFVNNEGVLLDQLDLKALQKLLTCPLSGDPFKDPVVAEDGETYERIYLEAYLQSNENKTPKNINQSKSPYPNRFIINLYDQARINELIELNVFDRDLFLEVKNRPLIEALTQYIQNRAIEKNHTGHTLGYCKFDKMIAPTHAIQVLNGKMSPHTFFSTHQNDLKILQQGTLNETAKPAIERINAMRK